MTAAITARADTGEGHSLALRFEGLPGPIVLDTAHEVMESLLAVVSGWKAAAHPASPADVAQAVSHVRSRRSRFEITSPWLDAPLTRLPTASAVCGVIADMAQSFYDCVPGRLALHCGAFMIGGRLVAMTGPARAGKSTFMARLTAEPDLRVLCDDVLPLMEDDRAMGLGIAPRLRLPLPENASDVFRAHVARHCTLRDDHYGYVTAPTVAPHGTRAPISVLVVLSRQAEGEARLHHLPPAEAVRHLLAQNMALIAPGAVEATVARLLRLAAETVCLRLVYSDLEPAVALVRAAFGGAALPDPGVTIHPAVPETMPEAPAPCDLADPDPADPGTVWMRAPGTGMRRVGDEVFVWQAATGEVHHLNAVGGAVWRLLDEPCSGRDMASLVTEAFAARDPGAVERDVCGLLGALDAAGLVMAVRDLPSPRRAPAP